MPSRRFLAVVLFFAAPGWGRALAQTAAAPPPATALIDVQVTGTGWPVVFIPGLATPGSVWDDTVAHFQASHTCYVVTVAGFGGLPPVPKREHFLADVRDAVIGYLRAQKVERPVIVGHSLGGLLALEIGSAAPDLPGGLVIVDSLPFLAALTGQGIDTAAQAQAMIAPMGVAMAAQKPAQFAEGQKQFIGAMVTDPAKAAALAAQTGKSDPATTGQAMAELMGRDLRPLLGTIKCPVLVLGALADKTHGNTKAADVEAAYRRQYANLPQAKFKFFAQSRHFIMIDDPRGFDDALSESLREGRERPPGGP